MSRAPEDSEYMVEEPRGWRGLSRLQREMIYLGAELLCGVLVVPLLIWVVGNRILGGYVHGSSQHAGAAALLGDFFTGLGNGSSVFWLVALGPAILVTVVRALVYLLRSGSVRQDDIPY
ncbi:MAG: hypothetical protein JSR36_01995 [Proteobacteria bacterium]|nr:hypothetical protein [Pseudomonadota bacterium]